MTAAELLESALKLSKKKGLIDCQFLTLLILARSGRPMRLCDLAADIGYHRQTVYKAVEGFVNGEVRVERPNKATSIVHLQQPGVDLLRELLCIDKAS